MNLGAVVPLISGTTAHPSGTTAGGAEHETKKTVAVLPPDRSGTAAYRRQTELPCLTAVQLLLNPTRIVQDPKSRR